MNILDSKGRLFGKVSLLDLGAALVILLVFIGIFIVPGAPGSIAQVNSAKETIQVDVLIRGLTVKEPDRLLSELDSNSNADIIIRNQPAGRVKIKDAQVLPRTVSVPQPDGTVKALPDPRPEVVLISDMLITVEGEGEDTGSGAILGNQKIKIGTGIELDGIDYNFRGSVSDVRF